MYSFLVVDDEYMICRSMHLMLERSGLPVGYIKDAYNGAEALEDLEKGSYDFVITDIRMPKMDGIELCGEINRRWPQTHMIIVSGYDDFGYAQQAVQCGVKDYILKPLSLKKVMNSLSRIMGDMKSRPSLLNFNFYELEQCTAKIENAVWDCSNEQLELECENLQRLLRRLSQDNAKPILEGILEAVTKRLSAKIGYDLDMVLKEAAEEDGCHRLFLYSLEDMIAQLKARKSDACYDLISKAKTYIENHFSEDVSLEMLGKKLNFNPSYFSQFFKHHTGQTFIEYRTNLRICKAKKLLCRPDKTVTEITFDVGYKNATHFIRTFKKHCGLTPSEYRREQGVKA